MDYTNFNGVKLPNIIAPHDKTLRFDRYAEAHRKFLKEHHRALYTALKMQCKLDRRLDEVQRRSEQMEEDIIRKTAAAEGVDEKLKADNVLLWVQSMNNIKARAREQVLLDVVYQR